MDFKKIIFYLGKFKFILAFAVLVALAAGLFGWWGGTKYSVSLSLTINRYGNQPSQDYRYDNYFALKATEEFGDTVAGWFKTPEMTQAIFKKAGLSNLPQNLNTLSRQFKAAKISPNLVEVRFGAKSEIEAKTLAQAVGQIVSERTNMISASSWQNISFLSVAGEPVVVKNTGLVWWNVLVGLLVGLAVGVFVKVGKEYFK
jgi:capsular polysaccharide biosynthesis protein